MTGQVCDVGSERANYGKAEVCEPIRESLVEYYLPLRQTSARTPTSGTTVLSYEKIRSLGSNNSGFKRRYR